MEDLALECTPLPSGYYTTVSFNISNEVYGEVLLLEQMLGVSPRYIIDHGVSVLRGMLCFYSTHNHWTEGRIGTFKLSEELFMRRASSHLVHLTFESS
ncbi:hypothetical protein H5410_044732 [Solanum commersonii]|uniref:Uncharacterized protein n=1 Tax=Solanum commersonii TaxID=4109 RepID=A0A9J5X8Y6_SOLCO|nr:hypothetical protein H5410_044732 [Solanum commersonii]